MDGWYVKSIEGGGSAPPGSPVHELFAALVARTKRERAATRSGRARRRGGQSVSAPAAEVALSD